ncbi:signal peptidase I [Heyndrickxia sporothermodurans]|uniref:signal peptidase I SipW n=1 Tax=Heyndrickxia sporothermodurans TaxID=46224 RepID=UPI000D3688AC|nr:signal peptidase I [Heyndrickxia sporothermodurans]MBL5794100.1 signal peptidase I [Heyndrickxia sporothermodurans]MBL5855112.1 signal peptidase I [Heyndrickxia sporothermodurans]PTY73851.1 signal peptidase I [Heyndrickxia sporothermodurans]
MKAKRIKKWISSIITTILFLVLVFMLFVVISSKASGGEPQFLGYQLKTVLSGSMEPGIKTGSIIAVKPAEDKTHFKKGDVITFKADEKTIVTHRIIEVNKNGTDVIYRTKGDNNKTADMEPVLSQNVLAKYTGFTLPYVGYFINFSQSKNGSALLLILLPGLLLLGYSIISIWRAIAQIDDKKTPPENIEKSA